MSKRNGKYYTLASYSEFHKRWSIEFGDWDHRTVNAERDDYRDHGVRAKYLVIFHTDGQQTSIDKQIARLNKTGAP
jgi:hypothetical protein